MQLAAHIYSAHLGDFDRAITFAKLGLVANPHEHSFRITSAFAYASSGRTLQAKEELKEIKGTMSAEIEVARIANLGLIGFRENDVARGRAFYHQAVELALTKENLSLRTTALAYWAREEALAGNRNGAIALLDRSKETSKAFTHVETPVLLAKVTAIVFPTEEPLPEIIQQLPQRKTLKIERDLDNLSVVRLSWNSSKQS